MEQQMRPVRSKNTLDLVHLKVNILMQILRFDTVKVFIGVTSRMSNHPLLHNRTFLANTQGGDLCGQFYLLNSNYDTLNLLTTSNINFKAAS